MINSTKTHARSTINLKDKEASPILTTGQDFLHSCLHFFGLQRSLLTIAILVNLSCSDIFASTTGANIERKGDAAMKISKLFHVAKSHTFFQNSRDSSLKVFDARFRFSWPKAGISREKILGGGESRQQVAMFRYGRNFYSSFSCTSQSCRKEGYRGCKK